MEKTESKTKGSAFFYFLYLFMFFNFFSFDKPEVFEQPLILLKESRLKIVKNGNPLIESIVSHFTPHRGFHIHSFNLL